MYVLLKKGMPHIWYTFSFADLFDPGLHEFLKIPKDASIEEIKDSLRANVNHASWYAHEKLKAFEKVFIEKVLNCNPASGGWRWSRREWQIRGILHAHGTARIGNDKDGNPPPDIHMWAARAIIGHTIEVDVPADQRTKEQNVQVGVGKKFGQMLCKYHDTLICTDIERKYQDFVKPLNRSDYPMAQHLHDIIDHDTDLFNLQVFLQRHRCKPGLCLRKLMKEGVCEEKCKYDFPRSENPSTYLNFKRKQKRDGTFTRFQIEIMGKRVNDTNISNHNKTIAKYLRVNHDFTLIFDEKRILDYITKYQTKPEKRSNVFNAALNTVFNSEFQDGLDTRAALKRVFTKVQGERDVSVPEIIHLLQGK